MSDPYRVLGVTPDNADDASIRAAYLEALRTHPPERDPTGFQRLRAAYEQISSHRRRLAYDLFHHESPSADEISARLLAPGTPRRPGADEIRAALAAGLGQR
jgi:curved DNA-binding protein CbpA